MPYFSIRLLAKDLLPSMAAAAFVGPKQAIPFSLSRSTSPMTSGSSGATTVKSIASRTANSTICPSSVAAIGTQTASAAMPPLPGSA